MNGIGLLIIIGIIAYALGNINPSIILGKIYSVDIKKEGSGNAGMTNTMRVIGPKAGIIVLLVDVLKAVLAVRGGFFFGGASGAMVGFACVVLGHCFPALWGFRGGKGVAASLGGAIALNGLAALCTIGVAAICILISRRVSVGSLVAAISFPIFISIFNPDFLIFTIGVAGFILIMHRENIGRLIRGEEEPMKFGKKEK